MPEPCAARFAFELVAYSIIRKGKSIVRYNGTDPDDNGVYIVEIHHTWWSQIPGLRNTMARQAAQAQLGAAGICVRHANADRTKKVASRFAMRLSFVGERLESCLPHDILAPIAEELGRCRIALEFELNVALAHSRAELVQRYGRSTADRLLEQFHDVYDRAGSTLLAELYNVPA